MITCLRALGAIVFTTFGLAPNALAQSPSPCLFSTLPVPNGNLENSLFDPWRVSAGSSSFVGTYVQDSVDGVTTNRCFHGNTDFALYQPSPVTLQLDVTYEVGFDVLNTAGSGHYVEVWDTTGSTRLYRSEYQWIGGGRGRVIGLFRPASTDDYTIQIVSDRAATVDNIHLRANPIAVRVRDARTAGAPSLVEVRGLPNANYALFLNWSGQLPGPFSLGPVCDGGWWLNGQVLQIQVGALNRFGQFDITLPIPVEFANLPVNYQAVMLPPTCAFGCPGEFRYF